MSDALTTPNLGGRPVIWTEERTAEAMAKYLDLVASGVLDIEIYKLPDMPSSWTVRKWMADVPGFAQRVTDARKESANVLAEQSVAVWETPMPADLDGARASAWAQVLRGKSASKQWLAGVRDRDGFGDHKGMTITHKADAKGLSDDELLAHAARLGLSGPLIEGIAQQVSVSSPNGDQEPDDEQISE
jgi:hypothetical protein